MCFALVDAERANVMWVHGALGFSNYAAVPFFCKRAVVARHLFMTFPLSMQPSIINEIHRRYFEAGADICETNTFSGTWVAQVIF